MFRINERGHSSASLGLGNDMEGESRFSAGLRTEYLHDSSTRHPSNAQCSIQGQGSRRDNPTVHDCLSAAEPHDRSSAKLFLDLRKRQINRSSTFSLFVSHYNPLLCPHVPARDSRMTCLL